MTIHLLPLPSRNKQDLTGFPDSRSTKKTLGHLQSPHQGTIFLKAGQRQADGKAAALPYLILPLAIPFTFSLLRGAIPSVRLTVCHPKPQGIKKGPPKGPRMTGSGWT